MNKRTAIMSRALVAVFLAMVGTVASWAADPVPAQPPVVHVLAPDPIALEGSSSGAFTLIRSGSTSAALVVNYTLSGTASNGVDYVKINDSTTIAAGFAAADIVVTPIVNAASHGNKRVVLTLVTNASYKLPEHKRASVTIIKDTFNEQPPTVALISPTNGSVFTFPATINLKADATDSDDAVAKVSFYANDDFLGQSTNSPFSLVWTNARPGRYALFARATDVSGKSTLSSPVHIAVMAAPPAPPMPNPMPTITLLSPTNGAVFAMRSNIHLEANASAPDGSALTVQFFGDQSFLGSLTKQPYSLTWSNVPPGRHIVTARAIEANGLTAIAMARITVSNAAPVVSIVSPANGASFSAHANLTISATATDSDDAVARVSFFANNRLLGRATQSPYEFTWTNVPAGLYRLSAIATDEFGESAVSQPIVISVK